MYRAIYDQKYQETLQLLEKGQIYTRPMLALKKLYVAKVIILVGFLILTFPYTVLYRVDTVTQMTKNIIKSPSISELQITYITSPCKKCWTLLPQINRYFMKARRAGADLHQFDSELTIV